MPRQLPGVQDGLDHQTPNQTRQQVHCLPVLRNACETRDVSFPAQQSHKVTSLYLTCQFHETKTQKRTTSMFGFLFRIDELDARPSTFASEQCDIMPGHPGEVQQLIRLSSVNGTPDSSLGRTLLYYTGTGLVAQCQVSFSLADS
jgi:hypothetical protein